jgi:mycothiol synthase
MTESIVDLAAPPEAPAIAGLVYRRWRDRSDYARMAAVSVSANIADGNNWVTTPESLEAQYAHMTNSTIEDDLILVDVGDETVAYGRVEWWDDQAGYRIYMMFGHIVPEWRRRGIGASMYALNERRIRQIAAGHVTDLPRFIQAQARDTALGNEALLRARGFEPVRYSYEMTRDLSQPIGSSLLPAGIEVRTPTPEQYRQVWDADVEAFRDHWGFREPSEEDYQGWLSWPNLAPHLWQVAWEGDQIVGMVQNFVNPEENARLNLRRGYTEGISVRRPWRKRGIASALINRSLLMFRAMGMAEAALGVDTENTSGALRVYESCGFTPIGRGTTYRKPLE